MEMLRMALQKGFGDDMRWYERNGKNFCTRKMAEWPEPELRKNEFGEEILNDLP